MTYTTVNITTRKIQMAFLKFLWALPAFVRPPTFVVAQNSFNERQVSRILRQSTGNMTLIYFKRYSKHVYKPVSHAGHTEENALYQWAGNSQYPGTVCIAVQREDHTWLMGIISWDDGPFYIWSVFPISHIDFRN